MWYPSCQPFFGRVLNHQLSWSVPLECSQNHRFKTARSVARIICFKSQLDSFVFEKNKNIWGTSWNHTHSVYLQYSFPTSFYDSYIIPTQIPYLTKKCSMFQTDFTLLLLILSRNVSPSQSAQTPGQKSSLPALAHCQEKFCFVSFLICLNWWKRVYRLCDRLWCYECPHEKN